jgi:hypothetical protein
MDSEKLKLGQQAVERLPRETWNTLGNEIIAQALTAVKTTMLASALGQRLTRIEDERAAGHAEIEEVADDLWVVTFYLGGKQLARVGIGRRPGGEFVPTELPGDHCCCVLSLTDDPTHPLYEVGIWLKGERAAKSRRVVRARQARQGRRPWGKHRRSNFRTRPGSFERGFC